VAAGYTGKVVIGMDVAASEFHDEGKYDLNFKYAKTEGNQYVSPDELGKFFHFSGLSL
jgi:enolase